MHFLSRIARHLRLSWENLSIPKVPSPPFLILFINSVCNLRCAHCFYWKELNQRDDLTVEELLALSQDLGRIENLNLSGGEPFLRKEFAEICRAFIRNNGVEKLYVPTNGFFTEKTVLAVGRVLEEPALQLLAVEISLDGMSEYHNRLRGSEESFEKAMETYEALVKLQEKDSRLRIHAVSTVTSENMEEVLELTRFLHDECPAVEHHNIALIRGDRKNPSLQGPDLMNYKNLADRVAQEWADREEGRLGGIVEPMLQWAKTHTAQEQKQVIPCRAGVLSGVVYANGDVSLCESHTPIGNLREKSFRKIWYSKEADALRTLIHNKECYCTNEIFLWPSITFQPFQLARVMLKARAWKSPPPLTDKVEEGERLSGPPGFR